jgi:tetratricopeptide (TPR) repeat protein
MKIMTAKEMTDAKYFYIYNYRGIFERSALNNAANISLATWYPVCMVNAASALMAENRYLESTVLNKMALSFPVEKPEGNILYNIAFAYNRLGDTTAELQYLKKAADKGTDILPVYERLGLIYYDFGLLDKALPAFNEAIKRKSTADYVLKGKTVIEGFSQRERFEIGLIKANEKLISKDFAAANEIYVYLLEKHYKNDIIHKNLGVYHFKTGNYKAALEEFVMSKNETSDPGTSLYLAYAYEKLGLRDDAIAELNEAIQRYPNDKGLSDLLKAIKEKRINGKSTDSSDRPR